MGYFDKFDQGKYVGKSTKGKFWHFIWHEDSLESWLLNIILAFVLIKYLVYPGLGFVFATSHPIVAVVSSSMYHGESFDRYWENGGEWYEQHTISKEHFSQFPLKNGFNKGDIMILLGRPFNSIDVGDVVVFQAKRPDPIIHRVVAKNYNDGVVSLQTKGDNYRTNPDSIRNPLLNELDIRENQVIGKAFIRVPYLGYVKILAVEFVCIFNDFSFCIR